MCECVFFLCLYIYICVCVCVCVFIYIYIYIYVLLFIPCPKFTTSFVVPLYSQHPNTNLLGYVLNLVICSSL